MARYLPESCLGKFGYVQGIPRPFPDVPSRGIDMWFRSNIVSRTIVIRENVVEVQFSWQFLDSYLE